MALGGTFFGAQLLAVHGVESFDSHAGPLVDPSRAGEALRVYPEGHLASAAAVELGAGTAQQSHPDPPAAPGAPHGQLAHPPGLGAVPTDRRPRDLAAVHGQQPQPGIEPHPLLAPLPALKRRRRVLPVILKRLVESLVDGALVLPGHARANGD